MPELTRRHRALVLLICCSSLFIVSMDNTIVNLALPAIQRDLGSSVSGLQWTIDAYIVVLAGLLMLAGSTADRVGRRRVFQVGLVMFAIGSLLCSVAPNIGSLIAFRAVQAIGGAMLNPVAMSIITNTFTEPRERARAIGMWGAVAGVSMAIGPLVGGVLVDTVGWRSIFWINVPVTVVAFVLAARFVPESRAARPRRIDLFGQLLIAVTLVALTFGIIEGSGYGWGSPLIVGCFVVAAAAAIGLVAVESRSPEPLIDPRFFRSIPFSSAVVTAVCAFAALAGFLFLNALYLQNVRGYTPLQAGLLTLPMAAMAALFPLLSGRIVGTRGSRIPLLVGGAGIVVGTGLLFAVIAPDTPLPVLMLAYVVFGIGFGMVNAPITNAAVSGMPLAQAGVASAVASTSRQIGTALGVAVIGALVTSQVAGPFADAFTAASRLGWAVMVGCGVVVFVVGIVSTGPRARATVASTAALFDAPPAPERARASR
ncbi:MAG: EmrB/QacA subfamily drug resistance transporter [Pseudonocardia sp.]|nr:EmrB/QacA subfamily drug resistance transporter [Pseudonocardia sp.]